MDDLMQSYQTEPKQGLPDIYFTNINKWWRIWQAAEPYLSNGLISDGGLSAECD